MIDTPTNLIVIVSIHFMILFTASSAFSTIVSKIHEDEGDNILGPFRFAVNYFAFMIANLFVSKVKYSEKKQIVLSTLTYVFYFVTAFFISGTPQYVKFIVVALGSIANGIGATFLWTSVGAYIHKICHKYGKENLKGHYYGLFNTIMSLSGIEGSVVITFGLSYFSNNIYFLIVTGVSCLSFLFGLFFIKDVQVQQKQSAEQEIKQKQGFCQSAKEVAVQTLKFYPKMKTTLGLIAIDGINIGITSNTMLHVMPSFEDLKQENFMAGIVLIFYGVGGIIGGYLGGKICDWWRIKASSVFLMVVFCITCGFTIYAEQIMEMWSAIVACFLWGFVAYSIFAILMVICSRLYGGRPQSFALTKQFHSFAFVIFEIVIIVTNNELPVTYTMIGLLVISIPTIWGICISPVESESQMKSSLVKDEIDKQEQIESNQNIKQELIKDQKQTV